jgi:hypothetical protein
MAVGACSSPESGLDVVARPIPGGSSIERAVDPVSGVTSIVLTPSPVQTLGPSDLGMKSLSVGAQYASRPLDGQATRDAFGLVFVAVADHATPIFERDRRLLLDIDGQLYTSVKNPSGLHSLYGARHTDAGIEERLVIPVGSDVLHSLAHAERVKGRLGSWVMFELAGERLEAFSELSRSLPAGSGAADDAPQAGDRTSVSPNELGWE